MGKITVFQYVVSAAIAAENRPITRRVRRSASIELPVSNPAYTKWLRPRTKGFGHGGCLGSSESTQNRTEKSTKINADSTGRKLSRAASSTCSQFVDKLHMAPATIYRSLSRVLTSLRRKSCGFIPIQTDSSFQTDSGDEKPLVEARPCSLKRSRILSRSCQKLVNVSFGGRETDWHPHGSRRHDDDRADWRPSEEVAPRVSRNGSRKCGLVCRGPGESPPYFSEPTPAI